MELKAELEQRMTKCNRCGSEEVSLKKDPNPEGSEDWVYCHHCANIEVIGSDLETKEQWPNPFNRWDLE